MQYYNDFSLKNYNSFKLESTAKEIWFPESLSELIEILNIVKTSSFYIIAGGTNIILKPVVNKIISLTKMPKKIKKYENLFVVDANVITNSLINNMIKSKMVGLEGLIGIPGTIGGAVVMNAGSGKYCISDYLIGVKTIDYTGKMYYYTKEQLKLSRRYTILQDKKEVVTKCIFQFKKGIINEEELEKAKLHRQSIPKEPSAGGIFLNWHLLKPYEKILIGLSSGDAKISDKVNIIINKGSATYDNIISLISTIQELIPELKLEVKIIK